MRTLLLTALALMAPKLVASQTVTGIVTAGRSGLPVRSAGAMLVDSAGKPRMAVLTDSLGRYRMTVSAPGRYRLRIQARAGLAGSESPLFTLAAGVTVERHVALSLSATALDTVRVRASLLVRPPAGNPNKYDEFHRRRKLGFGHFLTRADIEKTGMNMTHDLLRGIPGMLITQSGTKTTFQSKRCPGGSIPGLDPGALAGQRSGPDPKQQPMLFVDGIRVPGIESINDIHPGDIEAMEVYQGAAQVPAEAKGDACAAIFVWLKG